GLVRPRNRTGILELVDRVIGGYHVRANLPSKPLIVALTIFSVLSFLSTDPVKWALRQDPSSHQEPVAARERHAALQRFAFIDATSPGAHVALAQHAADLDGIIGEWLTANLDGSISEVEDPEQDDANIPATLAIARRTPGLQILAMLSDQGGDAEQSNGIRAFAQLSNPMYRARLAREILALTRKYGFDGIVLNFENPVGVEETDFQTFLTELAAQLKPDKKIAVLAPGDWQIDYKALAARSALVIVELFNEGLTGASALAPKAWSEEVVGLRTSDIPAEKLVFAVASFGRDWTDGAGSEPVAF